MKQRPLSPKDQLLIDCLTGIASERVKESGLVPSPATLKGHTCTLAARRIRWLVASNRRLRRINGYLTDPGFSGRKWNP